MRYETIDFLDRCCFSWKWQDCLDLRWNSSFDKYWQKFPLQFHRYIPEWGKLVWTRFCFTESFGCQETRDTVVGHYHGTLWKYNGMSFWCLYASYDVVWRNEVKWFSSNFCLKVGFSCLKTDLPSGIIWWQNQKLALKYVKNVRESKMFSASEGGVVC